MKLDAILQASLPRVLVNDMPVGPTLLVGLGGTGKEVLLRLRRIKRTVAVCVFLAGDVIIGPLRNRTYHVALDVFTKLTILVTS